MDGATKEILGSIVGALFLYKYIPAVYHHRKAKKIRGVSIAEKTVAMLAMSIQTFILIDTEIYSLAISSMIAICLDFVILYYRVTKQKSSKSLIYRLFFR